MKYPPAEMDANIQSGRLHPILSKMESGHPNVDAGFQCQLIYFRIFILALFLIGNLCCPSWRVYGHDGRKSELCRR